MQCVEENGKLEQRTLLIGNRISLFLKQWFSTRDNCALLQADIQQCPDIFKRQLFIYFKAYNSVVLVYSQICATVIIIQLSGHFLITCDCWSQWRSLCVTSTQWAEARDAAKYPTIHRTAHRHKESRPPNVSSAETENLALKGRC